MPELTPDQAISALKGLPEDRQRKILARLSPEVKKGILDKLKPSKPSAGSAEDDPNPKCDPWKELVPRAGVTISATPSGPMSWLNDLQGDIRQGSDLTLPGKVLKYLGAVGSERGVSPAVASFMPGGGTIEGGAKLLHGVGVVSHGHPIRGANEAMEGFGQAAAPFALLDPAALPTMAKYGLAGAGIGKALDTIGVDPETSEFIQNVILMKGGKDIIEGATEKVTGKRVDLLRLPKEQIAKVAKMAKEYMDKPYNAPKGWKPSGERVASEERQAKAHRQVISRIGGPISPAETTDVTRQLYRNQAAAMPEKVAAMKTGKPMEAVNAHRDIARATKRSIDDLHRGEVRKYRQSSFDGKAVADKLLASISDDEKSAMTAGDRERAISLLERIANQKNLGSANEMRITLGDETAGYDSHGNPQQVSPGFKKVLDRAYNISREEYYNRLKEVSGKDFSGLKKKEGYIIREIEAIDDARYKLEQKEELQKGKLGRERLGAAIKGVGGIVEGGFPSVPIVGPLAKFLGDKVSGSELERLQTQLNTMYSDLGEHVPIDVEGAYRGNETGPAVRPGPAPKGEQPKGPTAIELYQQAIELYQHGPAPRPGSVEVPTERGLPAPAGQKMLPGGGTKALSAPPAPWKEPPPFNPETAKHSTAVPLSEHLGVQGKGAVHITPPPDGFEVAPPRQLGRSSRTGESVSFNKERMKVDYHNEKTGEVILKPSGEKGAAPTKKVAVGETRTVFGKDMVVSDVASDGTVTLKPKTKADKPESTEGSLDFSAKPPAPEPKASEAASPTSTAKAEGAKPSSTEMVGNDPRVTTLPVDSVLLDPGRLQYKMDVGEKGVSELLKGAKWKDERAGVITVWRDPADGQVYVVNGHHRLDLAKRQGVKNIDVKFISAKDAAEARYKGALQNIGEGRGTSKDAAKVFRESGMGKDQLADEGLTVGEKTVQQGYSLSRLSPELFDEVIRGKMGPERGAAIGDATDDPIQQDALVRMIKEEERRGKKIDNDWIKEAGRFAKGDITKTVMNLFGEEEQTQSLMADKIKVSSHIRKSIRSTINDLGGKLSNESFANKVRTDKQNIDYEQNRIAAEKAVTNLYLYDKAFDKVGRIGDILDRAARDLAEGGREPDVLKRAVADVEGELENNPMGLHPTDAYQEPKK